MIDFLIKKWTKVLLLSCVFAVASAVSAQDLGTGTVEGSVTRGGTPVSNVRIELASLVVASFEATSYTDSQGLYYFSGVPIGAIEVNVFDYDDQKIGNHGGMVSDEGTVITIMLE